VAEEFLYTYYMNKKGFTLLEITAVAAMISSLSLGGYQLIKKGNDPVCLSNLKQIGLTLTLFEADNDGLLPGAVFYPDNEKDPKGIHNILRKYGAPKEIFFCPAISGEFNKYGTNYLWNERAKISSNSSVTWLMTEITSLYPELPYPHTGGYGILYMDGHVAIGKEINFPDFQKPSLSSAINPEK